MLRFYPDKTKVVFFDLEYYVPKGDRDRETPSGMIFSPVKHGHKILGGTFLVYYPIQDRVGLRSQIWEWSVGSEENVLQHIHRLFEREWKDLENKTQAGSLMLCGIGISHSDIPALLARFLTLNVTDPQRVYDLVCGCRQIDLSTVTLSQFSSKHAYFSYPKSKASLYQKFLARKSMSTGKSVWEHYENREWEAIECRCGIEVDDALSIYRAHFDLKARTQGAINRLKWFERKNASNVGE